MKAGGKAVVYSGDSDGWERLPAMALVNGNRWQLLAVVDGDHDWLVCRSCRCCGIGEQQQSECLGCIGLRSWDDESRMAVGYGPINVAWRDRGSLPTCARKTDLSPLRQYRMSLGLGWRDLLQMSWLLFIKLCFFFVGTLRVGRLEGFERLWETCECG
jgi:hypothetical protein